MPTSAMSTSRRSARVRPARRTGCRRRTAERIATCQAHSRSSCPRRTTRSGSAWRSATAPRSSSTRGSPTRCASRCPDASTATSPTDGADFVLVLADHGASGAGRSDRGLHAAAKLTWRWRRWPGCTVRAGAIRIGLNLSAISMPKPGDEAAAKGLGDVSKMAADITIDKLGARISAEDRETLAPRWVGDSVADGRTEAVRTDAR